MTMRRRPLNPSSELQLQHRHFAQMCAFSSRRFQGIGHRQCGHSTATAVSVSRSDQLAIEFLPTLRTPILRRAKIISALQAQSELLASAAAVQREITNHETSCPEEKGRPYRHAPCQNHAVFGITLELTPPISLEVLKAFNIQLSY